MLPGMIKTAIHSRISNSKINKIHRYQTVITIYFLDTEALLKESHDAMKEPEDKQIRKIKWIGVFHASLQTFLLLCRNTIVKKLKLDAGDVLLLTGGHQVFSALLIALMKGAPLWIWEVDKDRNIRNIRLLLGTFAICSGVMVVSELVACLLYTSPSPRD